MNYLLRSFPCKEWRGREWWANVEPKKIISRSLCCSKWESRLSWKWDVDLVWMERHRTHFLKQKSSSWWLVGCGLQKEETEKHIALDVFLPRDISSHTAILVLMSNLGHTSRSLAGPLHLFLSHKSMSAKHLLSWFGLQMSLKATC